MESTHHNASRQKSWQKVNRNFNQLVFFPSCEIKSGPAWGFPLAFNFVGFTREPYETQALLVFTSKTKKYPVCQRGSYRSYRSKLVAISSFIAIQLG